MRDVLLAPFAALMIVALVYVSHYVSVLWHRWRRQCRRNR